MQQLIYNVDERDVGNKKSGWEDSSIFMLIIEVLNVDHPEVRIR